MGEHMVKHIVFYTLRDDCNKTAAIAEIRSALEPLAGQVPGLICMQIRPVFKGGYDYALYAEFESADALAVYQKDPRHLAVKPVVHGYINSRISADFEV